MEDVDQIQYAEKIDYTQLLFMHIDRINYVLTMSQNVVGNQIYTAVTFLENLLIPYIGEEDQTLLNEMDKKYSKWLEDGNAIEEKVYWLWAREKHEFLIRMMHKRRLLLGERTSVNI